MLCKLQLSCGRFSICQSFYKLAAGSRLRDPAGAENGFWQPDAGIYSVAAAARRLLSSRFLTSSFNCLFLSLFLSDFVFDLEVLFA